MSRIIRVIRDVPQHWVGDGFPVRSLFSYHESNAFDPFLLLDYAGPHTFAPASNKRGVGEHPHRGFETVTIVYQGELEHRDSSGSHGTIGAGDVQWMTAAAGVVHEEFHSERFTQHGGTLEMVQLWVNLPAALKMSSPRYQELLHSQIPVLDLPAQAGTARVIAGELGGVRGVARTHSPLNIWDVQLRSQSDWSMLLPVGHTAMMIVQTGEVHLADVSSTKTELALFDRVGGSVFIQATIDSRLLILTGEPLDEPVVGQGPFVMNTREEILQAIHDYQSGAMGSLTKHDLP